MPAQTPLEGTLPLGSADEVYLPSSSAAEVLNFQLSDSGVLRSIPGFVPWDEAASYGSMHGVYHTLLDSGTRDVTLVRESGKLRVYDGWNRSWTNLATGLADEAGRFPDVFVEVAGKVIWSNGIDRPLAYDGYRLLYLGYDNAPGAPTAYGPEDVGDPVYRNDGGYSRPGRIGTVGDLLSGQDGSLLAGAWHYFVQWQDGFGNRSPLSAPSNPATVRSERTAVVAGTTQDVAWKTTGGAVHDLGAFSVVLDDLTRQFAVSFRPGPDGTERILLYRTKDVARNPRTAYLLADIPGNTCTFYPDNTPDVELVQESVDLAVVPSFRVACAHAGRLVIGNTSANQDMIMVSETNVPGTFRKLSYLKLPGEVTGLASFEGNLYAWTSMATFVVQVGDDGSLMATALSESIGCVAPHSIKATGWSALVWLAADGLYQMQGGSITRISDPKFETLNRSMLMAARAAFAVWQPEAREYVLFYPDAGGRSSRQILTFDGANFRTRDYATSFRCAAITRDHRALFLAGGTRDDGAGGSDLFVLNREMRGYNAPSRNYRFVSQWASPDATRRRRFNVSSIYVCFLEHAESDVTITLWGNGKRNTDPQWQKALTLRDVPNTPPASSLVIGTNRVVKPRTFWLKVDANLRSVDSFSFAVESSGNNPLTVVAWAADVTLVDSAGARVGRG